MPSHYSPTDTHLRPDTSLRIVIAAPDMQALELINNAVTHLGHRVSASFDTGRELIRSIEAAAPDLAICDSGLMDIGPALKALGSEVSTILVAEPPTLAPLPKFDSHLIWSCLIKPLRPADLHAAIALAIGRLRQFNALHRQIASFRRALDAMDQSLA